MATVGIVMGSDSDMPVMSRAAGILDEFGIDYDMLLFILSCMLYGIAFDFYNIAGSLYVEQNVDKSIRASAQGLLMMMSNGFGATIGMIGAGAVIDKYVFKAPVQDWSSAWFVFAGYMIVTAVLFSIFFKDSGTAKKP